MPWKFRSVVLVVLTPYSYDIDLEYWISTIHEVINTFTSFLNTLYTLLTTTKLWWVYKLNPRKLFSPPHPTQRYWVHSVLLTICLSILPFLSPRKLLKRIGWNFIITWCNYFSIFTSLSHTSNFECYIMFKYIIRLLSGWIIWVARKSSFQINTQHDRCYGEFYVLLEVKFYL